MDISNVGQILPHPNAQDGKKVPPQRANQTAVSREIAKSPSKKVDMRNVSPNEINQLIRAGVDGLLDVLPITNIDIPKFNNDPSSRNSWMNERMDFISQIEKSIEFKRSVAQSTEFLEKTLANLHRINGMNFPPRVDVIA